MSKKTMKQRIAVVAVSALTAGLFSVVSAPVANAAVGDLTLGANAGASVIDAAVAGVRSFGMISPTIATDLGASSTAVMYDNGTLVIHADGADNNTVVTVAGGTITSFIGTATLTGLNTIGSVGAQDFAIAIKPNAAGTVVTVRSFKNTTANTVTSTLGGTAVDRLDVTVTTAATAGGFSAGNSRSGVAAAAANAPVTTNADAVASSFVVNGGTGFVAFSLNDVNGLPMSTSTIMSASATGGAVVSFDNATYATNVQSTYGGAQGNIFVKQGTSNAPVAQTLVSLTVGAASTPFITKGFRIYGDVNTIELSAPKRGLVASANAAAFQLAVKDSAGSLIPAITPSVVGASIGASIAAVTPAASASTDVTAQAFTCSAAVGPGTITYSFTNARNQSITSNALPVVCAGAPFKYTASLDKASYTQGSIAILTISATDDKGALVNDYSPLGTAGGANAISITGGTTATVVTAALNTDTWTNGVKTIRYAVGTTAGSFNFVVDLPLYNSTSTPQTAITVPYTISGDGSVSNAAVLQSIVALIASINKQIAALQKLILARR